MENATPAPAKAEQRLVCQTTNSCANVGDCDSGSTAAVMFISPVKRMPKPIAIVPMVSELWKRKAMISNMPRMAASGARVEGLKNIQKGIRTRVQVEQTDDLARDRRANVRAGDDADGLVQCNDARADESDVRTIVAVGFG